MVWKEQADNFEKVPLGSHVARCIGIIDLGTRTGPFGSKRDCMIRWELPNEIMQSSKEHEVFTIGQFYTQSLGKKANLRAMLASWRGRDFTEEELCGFDPKTILGKPCMVNIIEKRKADGEINHVVGSVSPVPRGMSMPDPVNVQLFLSLEPDQFKEHDLLSLSEKMQAMVKESPEYKALRNGTALQTQYVRGNDEIGDDDVPF